MTPGTHRPRRNGTPSLRGKEHGATAALSAGPVRPGRGDPRAGRTLCPAMSADTAGYSGTPLPRKLGVAAGARVAVLGAPADFADRLPDAIVRTRLAGSFEVIVLFARSRAQLDRRLPAALGALGQGGGLWLAWPKRSSGVETDLDDGAVREAGLATGLVDNKVCAIDATWSGLRFMRRRAAR